MLIDHINKLNKFTEKNFMNFKILDKNIGYVHRSNVDLLKTSGNVFNITEDSVTLSDTFNTPESRTEVVTEITKKLHKDGVIKKWRDELYDVTENFGDTPIMQIEREAAPFFGITKYGVHLNGYNVDGDEMRMWIAKRSKDKSSFPSKLDQLVAGGYTAGYKPNDLLFKECTEEAGIPFALARNAKPAGTVSYMHDKNNTLEKLTLFVYDLITPDNFIPMPNDGEVESFELMPIGEVFDMVENTNEFKDNCNLVVTDFLIRHGLLQADYPKYTGIVSKLHPF